MRLLLLSLVLLLVCTCDEPVDTPAARIQLFTRCVVPSGAIQAEDRIEGAKHAEAWARVLLRRDKVDVFVASCGYSQALDEDFRSDAFAARSDPWWWDSRPGEVLSRGATFRDGDFTSELLVIPRDTDVAVYLHTRSR